MERGNKAKTGTDATLEVLLAQDYRVTDQTDVRDFLLVTGLDYRRTPAYVQSESVELRDEAERRFEERRSEVNEKLMSDRVATALHNGYEGSLYRTLREFRLFLRYHGLKTFGRGSEEYLNEILSKHGIKTVKRAF